MLLSDILGSAAFDGDGNRLGAVVDARFRLEGRTSPAQARMVALIISPRSTSSYLGYERKAASRPVILDRLLRWMHRGSYLVNWEDVAHIELHRVVLRPGFERRDAALEE
ncbi:MAG: PRC-barrel domain containing protein [Rhodoglobus sp.]|nr:PRC-barrel domain containing protein [Rhodoglobus sp.]